MLSALGSYENFTGGLSQSETEKYLKWNDFWVQTFHTILVNNKYLSTFFLFYLQEISYRTSSSVNPEQQGTV